MVDDEKLAVTDEKGHFRLSVPEDTKRLVVTVLDVKSDFAPTTKRLEFLRGRTVFPKIVLRSHDPPVEFDSERKVRKSSNLNFVPRLPRLNLWYSFRNDFGNYLVLRNVLSLAAF